MHHPRIIRALTHVAPKPERKLSLRRIAKRVPAAAPRIVLHLRYMLLRLMHVHLLRLHVMHVMPPDSTGGPCVSLPTHRKCESTQAGQCAARGRDLLLLRLLLVQAA